MKIALLGNGTVSKGVQKIINENFPEISIKYILTRNQELCNTKGFTSSIDEIVQDSEIDTVLEMIVGVEPAYSYICKALRHGKNVITSNKATVAEHLCEYIKEAKQNNCMFKFEACVAGGIPWIESLIKASRIDRINKLEGIMNGTTNYILDHMYRDENSFESILKSAQSLGYAEANPSSDVSGLDVKRKLKISASIAFKSELETDSIWTFGIEKIKLDDIHFFKEMKLVPRLIGKAVLVDNEYYASVEPVLFPVDSICACVQENNNITTLYGKTIGRLDFVGQGAGMLPTANAMIQDLLDIDKMIVDELAFCREKKLCKTLIKRKFLICTNELNIKLFSDFSIKNYKENNRMYIETKEIDDQVKEDLILYAQKNDEELFYAEIYEGNK